MEKMESQGLHLPCLGQRCPILISFSLFDYYVSCTLHPSTPPLPHSSYFIIYNLHVGCRTVEYHYITIKNCCWFYSKFDVHILNAGSPPGGPAGKAWHDSDAQGEVYRWVILPLFFEGTFQTIVLYERGWKVWFFPCFFFLIFWCPHLPASLFLYSKSKLHRGGTCSLDFPSLYVCFDAHIVPTFPPLDELDCSCTEEVLVPVVVLVLAAFYIFVCLLFFHEIV